MFTLILRTIVSLFKLVFTLIYYCFRDLAVFSTLPVFFMRNTNTSWVPVLTLITVAIITILGNDKERLHRAHALGANSTLGQAIANAPVVLNLFNLMIAVALLHLEPFRTPVVLDGLLSVIYIMLVTSLVVWNSKASEAARIGTLHRKAGEEMLKKIAGDNKLKA